MAATAFPAPTGLGDRREERSIVICHRRSVNVPTEHRELVA
jgi:hypothetical protein